MHKYSGVVGKYRLLLLLAFSSLLFLLLVSGVAAWKNGGYHGNQHEGTYRNYKYNVDYGTHDWLAEFAVERTLLNPALLGKWYDMEGNFFWTEDNWNAYLHGTYGPDNSKITHYTRYNQLIQGEGDRRRHAITFNDYKACVFTAAADQATKCGKAAVYALQDGDCPTAAFFMGEMAHYIGDMSSIFNVYHHDLHDSNNRPVNWNRMEDILDSRVNVRTSGLRWIGGAWSGSFSPDDRTSIFWVEGGVFIPYLGLDPGQFARMLAYNTYWGSDVPGLIGTYDWNWMWDALVKHGMKENSAWPHDATWHTRFDKTDIPYLFINRLEDSLNYGIKYIASALNWVIDNTGGNWECKANGNDPDPDGYMNRILNIMVKDTILKVASFTGIYGTLFAITFSATKLEKYVFA